jgi:hypothetical protein
MPAKHSIMKQGITLMAFGHPYYGRMAYNLALTLKAAEPDMPIAVITDETGLNHLDAEKKAIFSHIIKPKKKTKGMQASNSIRMQLYKLSPFSETIALDVDMVWMKGKPSDVFQHIANTDFAIVNEGYYDIDSEEDNTTKLYTYWGDREAIISAYGLKGRLYQVRGEFIVFRKSDITKAIFEEAGTIQKNPKVDVIKLGDSVTDEFALNISLCLNGITLPDTGWQPTYWANRNKGVLPNLHIINKEYYALSLGGNISSSKVKETHNLILQAAAYKLKLGLHSFFPLQSKRNFLTERRSM